MSEAVVSSTSSRSVQIFAIFAIFSNTPVILAQLILTSFGFNLRLLLKLS